MHDLQLVRRKVNVPIYPAHMIVVEYNFPVIGSILHASGHNI